VLDDLDLAVEHDLPGLALPAGLLVEWRGQSHAIEVKLRRDTETEAEALDQLVRYLDHAGLDEGWLVIFDLRSTKSWAERLTMREVEHRGKRVLVVGC
jgi:hypothetical protein